MNSKVMLIQGIFLYYTKTFEYKVYLQLDFRMSSLVSIITDDILRAFLIKKIFFEIKTRKNSISVLSTTNLHGISGLRCLMLLEFYM